MAVYYDDFKDYDQMVQSISSGIREQLPPAKSIVYAGYSNEGYDGKAIVVFKKDGALYENHDSHCSCMGLENWAPEQTSKAALLMRTDWPGLHEAIKAVRLRKRTI